MQRETSDKIKRFFTSPNHIILVLNIVIFLITDLFLYGENKTRVVYSFCLNWQAVFQGGQYYRLVSYMFLHADIQHIAGNMLMVFVLGDRLETYFGKGRYLLLYFSTGILAGLTSIVYNSMIMSNSVSVGASGADFGLVGALLCLLIFHGGHMEGITIRHLLLYLLLSFYNGFMSGTIDNAAHLGGFLAGLLVGFVLKLTLSRRRKVA